MKARLGAVAVAFLLGVGAGCGGDDTPCAGAEGCACDADDTCDEGLQCLSGLCVEDRAQDAGASDTGGQAGGGGGTGADSGTDAGSDSGTDAATDTGTDAATDSGTDAATDSGTDAATDTGTDAATDSGTDAATDSGSDSGTPACQAVPDGACPPAHVCECGRCQPVLPEPGCGLDTGWLGDDACLPPPDPSLGYQVHIGPDDYGNVSPFDLGSGSETSACWVFHVPEAMTTHAWGTHLSVRPGAFRSRIDLYQTTRADGGWVVCRDVGVGTNGDLAGQLVHALGTSVPPPLRAPDRDGLATTVPGAASAELDMHAFNFTGQPILRELWLNVYTVPSAQVTGAQLPLRALGGVGWSISPIAPGTDMVYAFTCPIGSAGRILELQGHFHAHGIRLSAYLQRNGGARFKVFETYDYVDPQLYRYDGCTENPSFSASAPGAFSGVLDVAAGDALEWECHIINDSAQPLTYSNQLETGEQCDLWGKTLGPSLQCAEL